MKATDLAASLALLFAACVSAPEEHAQVAAEPAGDPRGIAVSVVVIEVSAATVAELSGRVQDGIAPAGFQEVLLARGGDEARIVSRPKLVLSSGNTGYVTVSDEQSYTQDYELDSEGNPREVRGTLLEGIWVQARPTATTIDGADAVLLELSFRSSKILQPIRDAKITLAGGREAIVQLPEVEQLDASGTKVLRAGEAWILGDGSPRSLEGAGQGRVAIVTASLVDLPREAGFRAGIASASAISTSR